MKAFEEDLINLMENIQFRKVTDTFLNNLHSDLKKVKSSPNIFVFADKSRNVYETTADNYNKIVKDNVTRTYKVAENDILEDINCDLRDLANDLAIGNRIETMTTKEAFVTIKDHKDNFEVNPTYRLINPAKSELGKISKIILDDINSQIRNITGVHQWKNSLSVIDWFKNIKDKQRHSFVSFDIAEFYPSITEDLLDKTISWARNYVTISDQHVSIIKHARKSLLFNDGKTWIKRQNNTTFDVTMGSYDGAEVCELVGLFILNSLAEKYGRDNVGLYRDDGLILLKGTSKRQADKARKDLHLLFENFQLKIKAEISHQIVNFLDLTLNLREESYQPYRKPNNDPLYVNSHSNHPPSIIRQIPLSVNKRISQLSSDQNAFSAAAPMYENALNQSNYQPYLHYTPNNNGNNIKRRQRNIIWFNPPYSKNVRTNVGKIFLKLIDKHFPTSSPLHKIFNRNTVKVSYSCMDNCKSIISKHNTRILASRSTTTQKSSTRNSPSCNCRKRKECPLQGKCQLDCVVYKAEVVTSNSEPKEYIGMTGNTFKERFNNHTKSFTNVTYRNNTELSKYVWNLKEKQRDFTIKWSILKRAASYSSGGKRCNLCLQEKLCILKADKSNLLNRRCEVFSKCVHQKRFLAGKFKRAQARSRKQSNGNQRQQTGKVS